MKIFCIGTNKTATTSLEEAMKILNYRIHTRPIFWKGVRDGNNILSILPSIKTENKSDFFRDVPFNLFENYRVLDKEFPDAKFILTVRDPDGYFDSVLNWIKKWKCLAVYNFILKTTVTEQNKVNVLENYKKRNDDVIEYFKDRPGKLLVIDIAAGEGWEKLCPFLEKPIPEILFPHLNINK